MSKTSKQLANLSVKNLRSHPWLYAKLALAFAVLVFLLCLFSAYALTLNGMQNDVLAEHAAANQLLSYVPIDGLPDGTESFTAKRFDAEIYDVEEDDGDFSTEPKDPHAVTLTVDGAKSHKYNATYYYFRYYVNRIFAADRLLTENDRKELTSVYGSADVLTGRMPQAANEIALAEEFLDTFDLTGEQVLGKTVSIVVSRYEETIEISDLVVCGIIKREFTKLSGHGGYEDSFTPYVSLSQANPIFNDAERTKEVYVYSLPYWLTEEEIDSLIKQYGCQFFGDSWLDDMVRISLMQAIATKLFTVVGGALGFSVVLMIFLMMDKLIAVFSRDCGILLSCGMQFKQVKLLLLTMLAWVCLFAVIVAAILTTAGVLGINAAINDYYYMEITVSPVTVLALFGIGIAAVALVALVYYAYAVSKMKRLTIKEFLNTSLS